MYVEIMKTKLLFYGFLLLFYANINRIYAQDIVRFRYGKRSDSTYTYYYANIDVLNKNLKVYDSISIEKKYYLISTKLDQEKYFLQKLPFNDEMDNTLLIMDRRTLKKKVIAYLPFALSGFINFYSISPKNKTIYYISEEGGKIYSVDFNENHQEILSYPNGHLSFISISPQEDKLAFMLNDKTILVYSLEKRGIIYKYELSFGLSLLKWLNNEKIIFDDNDDVICNIYSGELSRNFEGHLAGISSDCNIIVFRDIPKEDNILFYHLYNYETKSTILLEKQEQEYRVSLNNDCKFMSIYYEKGEKWGIRIIDLNGNELFDISFENKLRFLDWIK